MLAMADPLGRVFASKSGLARRANVSREHVELALEVFLAPDVDSRTPDNEGRRVDSITGGWQLLNYRLYREMKDEEAKKEKNRIYQERFRSKSDSKGLSDKNLTVRNNKTMSDDVTESKDKEKEKSEEEEDKTITPAMVSNAVLSELCLSGRDLSVAMDHICTSEMAKGRNSTDLRDALILAWRDYEAARPNMTQYVKRPLTFFGDGDWRSKSKWPWKDGKPPMPAGTRVLTLTEKVLQQREAK